MSHGNGIGAWARLLKMKAVTTFYRRVHVFVRRLDQPIPAFQPGVPVTVEQLTEQDLPAYEVFRGKRHGAGAAARLAAGNRCFAAWHEREIVYAAWLATGRAHVSYLGGDLVLDPGDIYHFDSYTLPAFRQRGVAKAVYAHVLRWCRDEGYRRSIRLVAVENTAALRVTQALGCQSVGIYGCVRVGPWQRGWQRAEDEEALPTLVRSHSN